MSDQRCPKCNAQLVCPECLSEDLRKIGFDYTSRKQRYECKACGLHTTIPRCVTCDRDKPPKDRSERKLSESGRRCLTCDTEIQYCPNCGRDRLTGYGTRAWTRKDGTRMEKKMYLCGYCRRTTVHPTCNCDDPHMSPAAVIERDRRLRIKEI